jgi:hypothetical protein
MSLQLLPILLVAREVVVVVVCRYLSSCILSIIRSLVEGICCWYGRVSVVRETKITRRTAFESVYGIHLPGLPLHTQLR